MAQVRNVDPEVGQARARIAVAIRRGDTEAAERHRRELADARIIAAAKAVAARLPELTPAKREQIRVLLGADR